MISENAAAYFVPSDRGLPAEPRAEQRPLERTLHDVRLVDEYAWLKAENWREVMRDPFQLDPAIRAYLQAENSIRTRARRHRESLQDTLFAEMKGRRQRRMIPPCPTPMVPTPAARAIVRERRPAVPTAAAIPRTFLAPTAVRRVNPKSGPVFEKVTAQTGRVEVAGAAASLMATRSRAARPSSASATRGRSSGIELLASLADDAGSELLRPRGCATSTPAPFADVVPRGVCRRMVWTQDASAFYYVPARTRATTPPASFAVVLGYAGGRGCLRVSRGRSRFFSFQSTAVCRDGFRRSRPTTWSRSEAWLRGLTAPAAEPTLDPAAPDPASSPRSSTLPDFDGSQALIAQADADDAKDFKIVWSPLAAPGRAHWRDLVPHRPASIS